MKPYLPVRLPIDDLDYKRLFPFIGIANAELARYDGLLLGVVNPAILLSPITTQEAVLSSKIEGTQATLDEVLEHEAGIEATGEIKKDIQEISNYRKTLSIAYDEIQERPLSLYLIREMHRVLLDSVRGSQKTPGSFRTTQNWIGNAGCSIDKATYIPPEPLVMNDSLQNLEEYIAGESLDPLLQLAIIHAQFEIIHPFLDGNGRIGRLLIPLFLYKKGSISSPMFYLSSYLEKNREEYYQRLRAITESGDWDGWIEFFLKGIVAQAKENAQKVQSMLSLYDEMKQKIFEITRSQYSIQVLDAIFDKPIFQTSDFVKRTGIPKQTALPILQKLKNTESPILTEIREARGSRSGVLAFSELLNIAEGRNVF